MTSSLKKILSLIPGVAWASDIYKNYTLNRCKNLEEVFTCHYKKNLWGDDESISGPGSTLEYTANIREHFPKLFSDYNIHSFLDAPCGDYNWFAHVERPKGFSYTGADIVQSLIEKNQSKFGASDTQFQHLDITKELLPRADLWLCRDCLFHLSEKDIYLVLENFVKSDIAYLLTTSHTDCEQNEDITTGGFRLLNLELPPYNLPKALVSIDDYIEGFPVRKLGLWDKKQIKSTLT